MLVDAKGDCQLSFNSSVSETEHTHTPAKNRSQKSVLRRGERKEAIFSVRCSSLAGSVESRSMIPS